MKLKKITWEVNALEDGLKYYRGYIDDGSHNQMGCVTVGNIKECKDGSFRVVGEILKNHPYRTSVSRPDETSAKAFLAKVYIDSVKRFSNNPDEIESSEEFVETDSYVPYKWFSGNEGFDTHLQIQARALKMAFNIGDHEFAKDATHDWVKEVKSREDDFPSHPHGHRLERAALDLAEDWWLECYFSIEDKDDEISKIYYNS